MDLTTKEELATIDLPEELMIEILSRLPVKSLMRFRCLCKSLCALIEKPSFISKHLLNHHKNNNIIDDDDDDDDDDDGSFIIVKRRNDNNDSFLLLSYKTLDVISTDLGFQSLRRDDDHRATHEFLGCCNGVICVYDIWYNDIILWNPATRQMKLVPESSSSIPHGHPKDESSSVLSSRRREVGFGYDVKTNDYKVIRFPTFVYDPPIIHHDHDHVVRRGGGGGEDHRTEVYSLSTDSWRLIDDVIPATTCTSTRHHRTCVNGIYSTWGSVVVSVSDDDDDKQLEEYWKEVLISFDMTKEVFLLTTFPDIFFDADGNPLYDKNFTVLNEESFAIIQVTSTMWNHFDVWLLSEYGPYGSWTKVYSIGPFSDFLDLYPLGIWKKNELFFETSQGELVLGDPNTPTHLKNLQIHGEYAFLEILPYKESLVSIK